MGPVTAMAFDGCRSGLFFRALIEAVLLSICLILIQHSRFVRR